MYLSKNNFNSGHEPSLKIYGYLLSKLSFESYQNHELICDRDSWVLLWNELTHAQGECLGKVTCQFLHNLTYRPSPTLFLTPISFSSSVVDLAKVGLYVEVFEIWIPKIQKRSSPHIYYKYPQLGWKKKREQDMKKNWVELNFENINDLKKFITYYEVLSINDWQMVVGQWYWALPVIKGWPRSYYLDLMYRYEMYHLGKSIKSIFKGILVFFCQFFYLFLCHLDPQLFS